MRATATLMALAMISAGCAHVSEEEPAREDNRYACNAAAAQSLIGQTATQPVGAEAVRVTGARTLRWIRPGDAVTMDFRTDRLNLHIDAQNRITRVDCG